MEEPVAPDRLEAWLADDRVAVVVADRGGHIVCWDDAARRLVGWSAEEASGKRLDRVLGLERAFLPHLVEGGSVGSTAVVSLRARRQSGEPVELRALTHPITLGHSRAVAVVLCAKADLAGGTVPARTGPADPAELALAERIARTEAEQALRSLGQLQAVAAALGQVASVSAGVDQVVKEVAAATGADAISVYLWEAAAEQLRLLANRGSPSEMCVRFASVGLDTEIPVTEAFQTNEAVFVPSLRERRARFPALELAGPESHRSVAALPLVAGDRSLGALALAYRQERAFPPKERSHLQTLADLCAYALAREQLHDAEREARGERAVRGRLELLLDTARLVSSSLPRWEVVDRLVRLAVPAVADWCVVALPRGSALHRVAVAHAEPATDAMCRLLVGQWPFSLDGHSPLARAFRTGRPVTAEGLTPAVLRGWIDDPEYATFAEALGLKSFVAVPLESRGSVIGAAGFGRISPDGDSFDEQVPHLAAELAGFATIVVQQALDAVRERDLEAAFGPAGFPRRTARDGVTDAATQLLLVDEFPVVRQGIRLLVERSPDIEICGEAPSLAEAEAGEWDPDVVVHELVLPDCSGPKVVSRLVARFPRARLLVLTRVDQPTYVHLALTSGAKGYLLKESASGELVEAIRRIARGEAYVQPSLGSALAHWQAIPKRHVGSGGTALTRRELEVLELVALGHTNAEIADTLRVSLRTVETHRSHLAQKLGVRSRAALVTRARELGSGAVVDLRAAPGYAEVLTAPSPSGAPPA